MRILLASAVIAAVCLAGCRSTPPAGTPSTDGANYKVYHLRGKVLSTNAGTGEVTLDHEAIPGFMDAMTMPYKLKDPTILSELHPGDTITADVLVSQNPDADVVLDHIVVIAQGKPDYKPRCFITCPRLATRFRISSCATRTVAPSIWISSAARRCCSPLFTRAARCPTSARWSRTTLRSSIAQLAADPGALRQNASALHQLRSGTRHAGAAACLRRANTSAAMRKSAFAHWDFAVPTKPELLEMAKYFDVGITHGPDDTITHTLSTTLIGPHGKVGSVLSGQRVDAGAGGCGCEESSRQLLASGPTFRGVLGRFGDRG